MADYRKLESYHRFRGEVRERGTGIWDRPIRLPRSFYLLAYAWREVTGCAGGLRSHDLQIMSLASYRTAPRRFKDARVSTALTDAKPQDKPKGRGCQSLTSMFLHFGHWKIA